MGMWCMLASPLLMSADLRTIRPEFKAILLNKNLIELNQVGSISILRIKCQFYKQDKLGQQAKRIFRGWEIDVYKRELSPDNHGMNPVAVAFLNKNPSRTQKASFRLADLGLNHAAGYQATEIFSGEELGQGHFKPYDILRHDVKPTGILLVKFVEK